ncbi:hypothetical protein FOQG_14293 [Fusarium oxysporum f. sp. raphani 54005]|uniref:DUF2961 domain-containing protein n=1 Tax=Fusarium oxysporum f. sp. raphani 54005 TaxID=1089458 RepID=X0BHF6_FUSOX|nr:hypothetical protein FOQG_14293 [Fusarium oxysporum f. sp. raphani 54005]WKT49477.1 hypothetical protein QSH57_014424 [Fusarium oxysporum f. sp. vasinfectum]
MSNPISSLQGGILNNVAKLKTARTARVSSWDHSGLNEDAWVIQPGETAVLADLEGPGTITHLWFVQTCRRIVGPGLIPYSKSGVAMMEVHNALGLNYEVSDPDYYRKVIIKMYWDDSETPNVLAPIGDFFCLGHSMAANFQSLPFTVSVKPSEEKKFGGAAAFNCYLPMPFNKRARIEIENQNDEAYFQYFYIDYELFPEPLSKDTLYFHSHWRRENPTNGWAPENIQTNSLETQVPNLDGKGNYVILETEGAGQYIGCNHSVAHFQGTWWGEGDDMIFIDDDTWPPSMHGTGGEDYFTQGWGMQKNAYPFCGTIIHEEDVPNHQVSYRWHLADPVRFSKKIRVTMESGHANHLRDDWSTTAYWYQTLPGPKLSIQPVEERIPRKPDFPAGKRPEPPNTESLDPKRKAMIQQHQDRMEAFVQDRNQWLERRAKATQERSKKNIEHAKDIRTRFYESLKGDNM